MKEVFVDALHPQTKVLKEREERKTSRQIDRHIEAEKDRTREKNEKVR
jgi:hypothetical protein